MPPAGSQVIPEDRTAGRVPAPIAVLLIVGAAFQTQVIRHMWLNDIAKGQSKTALAALRPSPIPKLVWSPEIAPA